MEQYPYYTYQHVSCLLEETGSEPNIGAKLEVDGQGTLLREDAAIGRINDNGFHLHLIEKWMSHHAQVMVSYEGNNKITLYFLLDLRKTCEENNLLHADYRIIAEDDANAELRRAVCRQTKEKEPLNAISQPDGTISLISLAGKIGTISAEDAANIQNQKNSWTAFLQSFVLGETPMQDYVAVRLYFGVNPPKVVSLEKERTLSETKTEAFPAVTQQPPKKEDARQPETPENNNTVHEEAIKSDDGKDNQKENTDVEKEAPQKHNKKKKAIIIFTAVLLFVLIFAGIAAGTWYWKSQQAAAEEAAQEVQMTETEYICMLTKQAAEPYLQEGAQWRDISSWDIATNHKEDGTVLFEVSTILDVPDTEDRNTESDQFISLLTAQGSYDPQTMEWKIETLSIDNEQKI